MQEKASFKTINRLIYIGLFTLIICLIFVVSKYIGVIYLISKILRSFIPLLIAIFVSFILEPFIGLFLKRGLKRKYSVLLVYVLLILIVGLLLYFTIPSFMKQIEIFINNIPFLIGTVENFIDKLGVNLPKGQLSNVFNNIFQYLIYSKTW